MSISRELMALMGGGSGFNSTEGLGSAVWIDLSLAESGVEKAPAARPDLIVLDIHLPDMSGIEVQEELRRRPEIRHIPVIASIPFAMPGDIARGMEAGFGAYLTKPLGVQNVVYTFVASLRRQRDRRQENRSAAR